MTLFNISIQSINKNIVIIVWYFYEFCLIDHSLFKTLSQKFVQIVKILININFRSTKSSQTRNIKILTKSIDYFLNWITTSFVFRIVVLQFFAKIEQYRQSTIFQNFDNHKSIDSSIESSTINNSISKRQFFILDKQTFTKIFVFRRARFYQTNDISMSKKINLRFEFFVHLIIHSSSIRTSTILSIDLISIIKLTINLLMIIN